MTKDDLIESNKQALFTIRNLLRETEGNSTIDKRHISVCHQLASQQWYLIDNEKLKDKRR